MTVDQALRDLLEDAARLDVRPGWVSPNWVTTASQYRWPADEATAMWQKFSDAVRDRDALLAQTAEYERFFDITDPDAPSRDDALDVLASRVDDVFIDLLRGPHYPPLRAVA